MRLPVSPNLALETAEYAEHAERGASRRVDKERDWVEQTSRRSPPTTKATNPTLLHPRNSS